MGHFHQTKSSDTHFSFYKQYQAEIGKKSKNVATPWGWTLDKNVQKNKFVCFNEIT